VPDDVMGGIVEERLAKPDDTRNRGYILDGFPRTVAQAESLAEITADRPSTWWSTSRCPPTWCSSASPPAGCASTAAPTTPSTCPPKHGWTCDNCGGEVVQRADDTEEAIQRRLDLYERETAPLIAWYRERDLLVGRRRGRPRRGHRPGDPGHRRARRPT
jgi:adenylate kinase